MLQNICSGSEIMLRKAPMTAYEIISIFIWILALLMSFGRLIVAIIAFPDKRNKRKQSPAGCASGPVHSIKCPPCLTHRVGGVRKDK